MSEQQIEQSCPVGVCEACYAERGVPWFGTSSLIAVYCPHSQTVASWIGDRWHIVTPINPESAAKLLEAHVKSIASQLRAELEAAGDDTVRRAAVDSLMTEFGAWLVNVEDRLRQVAGAELH